MTIAEQLDQELKDAMRAKDADRVACIRQVRAKAQETENAPGFKGPKDDAFWSGVIGKYIKTMEKAVGELAAAGDKGEALKRKYEGEVAYLSKYMPKRLGEPETRLLVQEAIAAAGAINASQSGKVMGVIMKTHKDRVDTQLVKQLLNELLPKA